MRLFIAVDLTDQQKKQLLSLQNELRQVFRDVKWVEPPGYHVTVKFLGDGMDDAKVENICSLMDEAVRSRKPFEIALQGLGVFPNRRNPRIIWSGVEKGSIHIIDLWKDLELILTREGFSPSANSFTPHVTLGRIRRFNKEVSLDNILKTYSSFSTSPSRIKHVTLYQSLISRRGATYIPRKKINF